ncbi:hypothetical protein D1007_48684 [Hordeum vulgare]|nr:hypothetical protein D1007_48684 [Hordeum vulgare]
MVCQRRALEEIAVRRRGREEGGVVILDESHEGAPVPVCLSDPGQGSSKDDTGAHGNDDDDSLQAPRHVEGGGDGL